MGYSSEQDAHKMRVEGRRLQGQSHPNARETLARLNKQKVERERKAEQQDRKKAEKAKRAADAKAKRDAKKPPRI